MLGGKVAEDLDPSAEKEEDSKGKINKLRQPEIVSDSNNRHTFQPKSQGELVEDVRRHTAAMRAADALQKRIISSSSSRRRFRSFSSSHKEGTEMMPIIITTTGADLLRQKGVNNGFRSWYSESVYERWKVVVQGLSLELEKERPDGLQKLPTSTLDVKVAGYWV